MASDPMALTQCNFRLPAWQKRKLMQIAEASNKTFEGFLQDCANDILDAHLDDLEAENRIVTDFIDHARQRQKFSIPPTKRQR